MTDHDTIVGAMAAHKLDPEMVIIGEEISTTCGEILGTYMTNNIPLGLAPQEAIKLLRNQGAFISVSHPLDAWRRGAWKTEQLLKISFKVDAIEIFNARCMIPSVFNGQ